MLAEANEYVVQRSQRNNCYSPRESGQHTGKTRGRAQREKDTNPWQALSRFALPIRPAFVQLRSRSPPFATNWSRVSACGRCSGTTRDAFTKPRGVGTPQAVRSTQIPQLWSASAKSGGIQRHPTRTLIEEWRMAAPKSGVGVVQKFGFTGALGAWI